MDSGDILQKEGLAPIPLFTMAELEAGVKGAKLLLLSRVTATP
jgi:hypothetical protein